MKEICFIGDIHGCVEQLNEIFVAAAKRTQNFVFLGDYVNRGPSSREVIDFLVELKANEQLSATFLAGNHDTAFLQTLTGDGLDAFLLIGGAATIKSYVGTPKPDVLAQFRAAVPESHLRFLLDLDHKFVGNGIMAAHEPQSEWVPGQTAVMSVFGHRPQPELIPIISDLHAYIDTGCGTLPNGRLTGFFWPNRDWIQSTTWDQPQAIERI